MKRYLDMSRTETKPQNDAMRQFRQWMAHHYVNVSIKGSDKEFHSTKELLWRMRETLPTLTIGDVAKVMGELQFDTALLGESVVWVMYRIDGERQLEEEFGLNTEGG